MAIAVAVLMAVDMNFRVEAPNLLFDFLATSDPAEVEFGEGVLGVGGEGAMAVGELAGHVEIAKHELAAGEGVAEGDDGGVVIGVDVWLVELGEVVGRVAVGGQGGGPVAEIVVGPRALFAYFIFFCDVEGVGVVFALAIPGEEGDDLDGVGVAGDGERPCLHAELVT